jgi:hypothetical protein
VKVQVDRSDGFHGRVFLDGGFWAWHPIRRTTKLQEIIKMPASKSAHKSGHSHSAGSKSASKGATKSRGASGKKEAASASSAAPAPAKDKQKGSKLASLKSAIFGAAKAKLAAAPPSKKAPAAAGKSVASKASQPPAKVASGSARNAPKGDATVKSSAGDTKKVKAVPQFANAPVPGRGKNRPGAPTAAAVAAAAALSRAKPGGKPSGSSRMSAHDGEVCREVACEGLGTSAGYCRMHYIKNWKKIKRKEVILKEGKLNKYIEELVAKYPDKYIEAIRQDLANDKDFAKVIHDLDLDESVDDFDGEGESIDAIVGDIKRDFDDEGDTGF